MNFWHAPLKQIHRPVTGKRLFVGRGTTFAPEVNAPMRPQDAAEFMTLWGLPGGDWIFPKEFCCWIFERHRTSPPNVWWKGDFFSSCKQKLVSHIFRCASRFFFFRILFVRNWRGAKMMDAFVYLEDTLDLFSRLHRNCKASKTPGARQPLVEDHKLP